MSSVVLVALVASLGVSAPPSPTAPAAASTAVSSPPATAAARDDKLSGLLGVAVTAADEGRYCDALYLFEALNARQPGPRSLYNAAEVAFAAGDRVKALDLFRLTQQRYPDFEKSSLVQGRVNLVFKEMTKQGPGTACPLREDTCGDWFLRPIDGGEKCDDGNRDSGDGCDANCTVTACGNGVVTTGEACDDGNAVDGDGCDKNCSVSACGNGIVAGGEACDDGNFVDGDGCDRTCVPTGCGNGVVSPGEECDDGNAENGDGCDRGCLISRCGNGIVTGLEQCDDQNSVDGDGCEGDCTISMAPAPLPGVALAGLSALGAIGGGALLFTSQNIFDAEAAARDALDARVAEFGDDPEGSVDGIDDVRAAAEDARQTSATFGVPMLAGGASLVGIGAFGVVAGVVWAIVNRAPMDPEDAPPPATAEAQ